MPLLLVPLWLASVGLGPSALAPGEVDAVELPWARYQELRAAADEPGPEPGPWVAERDVRLRPIEGGWDLEVRWTVHAETAGLLAGELLGPGIQLRHATLGGKPAPAVSLPGGATVLAAWIEGGPGREVPLVARAFVPGALDERLVLSLLPATRGQLRASVPGRVLVPQADEAGDEAPPLLAGGVVWSGASRVALELRDPDRAPPAREVLAVAHAGVGLTVGDAEVRGRAHVQWELRHGALERVRATVADLGEDLVVEGRDVARWSRTGDTLDVELNAPVGGRVELELRWSQAVPPGDEARLPVPRIEPDAWRSESSLQLARDGEIEVIPAAEDWTAVAAAELPPWGQGLVEGTPTAAYQRAGGTGAGHLELLRFIPVPGPPTVVDVAAYTMATTEEGRVLMKAYYEVRNDRGAHLTVRPPEGLHIIGARVAGETALPSRGDGEAWRIPLKRSLETVEGLLSFPVEVILIGEQAPWARHEQRELALPTLDAPIAASRVTLHLPPRYRSRLEEGEHNVVGSFGEGEGLTYGRGVGEVGAAEADALFQSAVEGYLDNDFAQAQAKLEQLEQLGVSNENMVRLQANLDVIEGKEGAKDKGDRTLERRVKEQAKARATDEFRQQEVLIAEAEQAASAGDYERAELQYQAAIEIGGKLAKLEQTESVEQDYRNEDLAVQLQSVSGKKDEKKKSKKGKLAGNRRSVFKSRDATTSSSIRYDADPSFDGDGDEDWDEEVGGDRGELTNVPRGPMPGSNLAPEPAPPKAAPQDGPASEVTLGLDAPPPDDVSIVDANGIEDPGPGTGNMVSDVVLEDMPLPEPEPEPEPMLQLESEMFARSRRQPVRRLLRVIGSRARERRTVKYKRAPARGLGRGRRGGAGSEAPSGDGAVFYDFADDGIDPSRTMPQDVEPAKSIERLAAPEVTASALSVVIPATGLTVRYEQLLLDANQTQTVTIDARRRRGR